MFFVGSEMRLTDLEVPWVFISLFKNGGYVSFFQSLGLPQLLKYD